MENPDFKDPDPGPITVVHLITELNMGGAERMLYRLVSRMDRDRFRSTVISMTDTGVVGEMIRAEGIPVFSLGMRLGRPSITGFVRLLRLLSRRRADILQTWLYHADLMGAVAGRMTGVGRIVWGIRCSDMDLDHYRRLTSLTVTLGGLVSPLADVIVVNSEKGKEVHIRRGYHRSRMVIIPNGIDTERFHPDPSAKSWLTRYLGLPEGVLLVGLVARFDPMKDQENFFKAASLLAPRNASVHFVMVGKGMDHDNREILPLLEGQRLQGRVHLLGLREDIPKITAALDIASSSSAFGEGFSNTIGEAMSCAVPCVVTDVGDSALIVGDTGIIVSPRDPEALSEAWLKLIEMGEKERKEMGRRARLRIEEHFEMGRAVRRFEVLYEKIAAGI